MLQPMGLLSFPNDTRKSWGVPDLYKRGLTGRDWTDNAIGKAKRLWDDYEAQKAIASVANSWLVGDNDVPVLPRDQWAPDYQALQDASPSAYMKVAIAEMTQCLYVEGHLPGDPHQTPGATDNTIATPTRSYSKVWDKIWQPNRMDGRQVAIHRSAMAHGVSYVVAEMGEQTFTGEKLVTLRGVSALSGCALWRTGEVQEFPESFIEVRDDLDDQGREMQLVKVYDERWVYVLHHYGAGSADDRDQWVPIDRYEHGAPVVPVVAFCNDEDLDNLVQGEITPVIPILKRIDQDTFDRLIVQRFGSWRIRTATGIKLPAPNTPEAQQLMETLSVESILASENEHAKFGTLEPTQLDGYIAAKDADLRDFASIMQVPPHHILGLSPNVSADGLVEAQASLMRKMEERQHLFGESWELLMRLAAHMMGFKDAAADFGAQVAWRDMESRSLAQMADALGKLATMLEIPPELLWNRLPNWTQQDTEMALVARKAMLEREEEAMLLEAQAKAGATGAPSSGAVRAGLDDKERRRINRMMGGRGPDWDGDGKPN